MSKVDAQRAMREAKYARERASGPTRAAVAAAAAAGTPGSAPVGQAAGAPAGAKARAAKTAEKAAGTPVAAPAADAGERCGHKSMNGRACTRELGHPEKNHRYS